MSGGGPEDYNLNQVIDRKVKRLLYLKRVRFKWGNKKGVVSPTLEAMLKALKAATNGWAERHWPSAPTDGSSFANGTRCMYVGTIGKRTTGAADGTYFTVGSYVYGKGEHQIAVDLKGSRPDIESGPLYDKTGRQRSLLHEFRCVTLGETLIIQNERGGGGIPALESLLTHLFRKFIDGDLPRVQLVDVFSTGFRGVIEQGGGVETLRIRMLGAGGEPDAKKRFAAPLWGVQSLVDGAGKFTVEWDAADDDGLDVDQVIDAFNELQAGASTYGESALDKIDVKTVHGGWVNQLGKYRARYELDVTVDAHGIEHKNEIRPGLFKYLDQLRVTAKGQKWRIIDNDGNFLSGAVLKPKKK